jgi:hypothetical protein
VNVGCVNVVKVFSANKAKSRESLGETVTNPDVRVHKTFVMLSSDSEYHCLSILLIGAGPPETATT